MFTGTVIARRGSGISETVMHFLPNGDYKGIDNKGSKFVIMADWDDAPHLSPEQKKKLWDSIPPYQRDARSKGIPQLGSGVIYPVPESEIEVPDFEIPEHWPRLYAMDVGWNNTAACWGAVDRDTGVIYINSVYKKGEAEPAIHAQAIRSRGDWIQGKIDPASRGRSQADGIQLIQSYLDLGLKVDMAQNAVESGLYRCWEGLSTGKIKVFKSQRQWFDEFRIYRRNEKGQIVKKDDHIMDAFRYLIMSIDQAKVKPVKNKMKPQIIGGGWMG